MVFMNNSRFLFLIAFVVGVSVMAIEITASRILAPHFGTSIFVWTNIIGVVMMSLSLGYWLGGKIVDKNPKLELLLKFILGAGLFFLVVPFLSNNLIDVVSENILFFDSGVVILFVGSFLSSFILFGFPMFLLGITSPFLIKLYSINNKEHEGETSGTIFAISTLGSIFGTFLPSLVLIPFIGTKFTIYLFSCILIFLGVAGVFSLKNKFLFLIIPFICFFSLNPSISTNASTVIEKESAYQFINVTSYDNKRYYISYNEGRGIQSILDKDNFLTGQYYDYASLLPLMKDGESSEYLLIGLAGGTIVNALDKIYGKNVIVTAVEIDKDVIEISKDLLSLENSSLNAINMDGRMFLKFNEKKYDFIYIDVYINEMYVPWTFSTSEFWKIVKNSLKEDGVVGINLFSRGENTDFLKIFSNTIAKEFDYTYGLWPIKNGSYNYAVFASDESIDFNKMKEKKEYRVLNEQINYFLRNYINVNYSENIKVFTDDWCPVEFLTDKIIFN